MTNLLLLASAAPLLYCKVCKVDFLLATLARLDTNYVYVSDYCYDPSVATKDLVSDTQ